MFALNWFWSFLYRIGLLQKKATIILVAVARYKLKHGTVRSFVPTQRAQCDEMVIGNVRLTAWDLGGHAEVRHLWSEWLVAVDAIIFVVDSADYDRMQEAKNELAVLLEEPSLASVPFLLLANKNDLRTALKPEQLASSLGLSAAAVNGAQAEPGSRPLRLFSCSLVEGSGYEAAFEWLASVL